MQGALSSMLKRAMAGAWEKYQQTGQEEVCEQGRRRCNQADAEQAAVDGHREVAVHSCRDASRAVHGAGCTGSSTQTSSEYHSRCN